MSAKYNVVERRNPSNPEAPARYYPSVVSSGRLNLRGLSNLTAEISTLSTVDTMAAIEALLIVIPRELANGNIVDLGDFGSFRLRIQTEGADTPEEVTSRNITKAMPRFVPGREFKNALSSAKAVPERQEQSAVAQFGQNRRGRRWTGRSNGGQCSQEKLGEP